jgi:hypothetical protein
MSTNLQTGTEPGLSSLLAGVFDDIQELLKQQLKLFKAEINADMKRTAEAAVLMVAGGFVVLVGMALLCLMLVHLLNWIFPHLPMWACYGVVGLGLALIGGGLALLGRSKFRSFNPLPDESLAALKENLEWTTKPR